MIELLPMQLGTPEHDLEEAFLPFPVALDAKKIDVENIKLTTPADAANAILNGKAPAGGGIFWDYRHNDFGAVDLLAFHRDGLQVTALPSPKRAIEKGTKSIISPCGSFWTMPDGRVFVTALIESATRAQWMEGYRVIGSIGTRHLGMNAQRLELSNTSPDGLMIIRERPPQFSF